jgi:short-subunit dehydrogenase
VSATRTALVTGACSGIGLALAKSLAARGHDLLLVSNREAPLNAVAQDLAREWGGARSADRPRSRAP